MSRGNGVGRQAPPWPEAARDRSWQREDASAGWSRQGGHHPTSPGGQHACPVPVRLLLLPMVCLVVAACGGSGDDISGAAPATTTTSSATWDLGITRSG